MSKEKSIEDEYNSIRMALLMLSTVDLPKLRASISYAEAMGPMLEPTMWINGGSKNLREQSKLLDAISDAWTYAKSMEIEP